MSRSLPTLAKDTLRWVDHLPAAATWSVGIALGALAGAALAGAAPIAVGGAGFLVLLGLAGWLVWSGEPVAALAEPASVPAPTQPASPPRVELVEIPAGSFRMGSPEGEEGHHTSEEPIHRVDVSAFACMKAPVSRKLYGEVTGSDPGWPGEPAAAAADRPVNNVSWFDAVAFCNRLSEQEGLRPCYRISGIRGERVSWDRAAEGYRLPTEAEWEYACRAGTTSRWSCGDDQWQLGSFAWFDENGGGQPHPVGQKKPNAWELYDLHGNVQEWCWDFLGPYPAGAQRDPDGPRNSPTRVLRGGSYLSRAGDLRSAKRGWGQPHDRLRSIGFRCVRTAGRLD